MLDNLLGTDEGLREYLWSPQAGMMYAMGTLAEGMYMRYIITLIFDMFITVILFKTVRTRSAQTLDVPAMVAALTRRDGCCAHASLVLEPLVRRSSIPSSSSSQGSPSPAASGSPTASSPPSSRC